MCNVDSFWSSCQLDQVSVDVLGPRANAELLFKIHVAVLASYEPSQKQTFRFFSKTQPSELDQHLVILLLSMYKIQLKFSTSLPCCLLPTLHFPWYFVDRASQYNLSFILFPTWYTAFLFTYNNCYLLSSTCFRPHRPIIRKSKLYMQPVVFSPSADVFVLRQLRKNCPFSTAARQRHLQRGRIP